MKRLLFLFILTNWVVDSYSQDEVKLKSILTFIPCSYHEISRVDASWLLMQKSSNVIQYIRNIKFVCDRENRIQSQHALLYLGLFGDTSDLELINKLEKCEESCSDELPPCEYYCAYLTSKKLLEIRFKNGTVEPLNDSNWPTWSSKINIQTIQPILNKFSEDTLVKTLFDKNIRIKIPDNLLNELNEHQFESFYSFSVYYNLAKKANHINTNIGLLQELLYLYDRDTSGDGGVNNLEQAILLIEKRILEMNNEKKE